MKGTFMGPLPEIIEQLGSRLGPQFGNHHVHLGEGWASVC